MTSNMHETYAWLRDRGFMRETTRDDLSRAKTVLELFYLVEAFDGVTPSAPRLRAWVNTVLGPLDIVADIRALCRVTTG